MDRDVETSPSDMTFETTSVERLFETRAPPTPAARRRFVAILVVCLLIHASTLFVLIRENGFFPLVVSAAQEIPVEVVIEPPPPDKAEPPAPQEEPPKVQNTLDEKPAVDAPRAANDEKIEREAPDEVSQAPRVAPPPEQAAPLPMPENQPSPAQDAASQAAPEPSAQEPAEAKAQPEKAAKSVADLLAGFKPLPNYQVGSAAKSTPVAGGRAKATYLSILYGLIMPHMITPPRVRGGPSRAEGEIAFDIDGMGKLTYQEVLRSSGLQDLDAAALAAIRQASPFPTPPSGLPLALTFTYTTAK
jgi:protein TonB